MSLSHSLTTPPLHRANHLVPWQFRVHPMLVTITGSVVAVLLAVGALITGRRLLGAIESDLSPDAMLLTAIVAAIVISSTRIAWRRNFPLETPADLSTTDQLLGWGSSTALALLAIGCCYPANRTTDWLIWLPILVADQLWRQNFFDSGEPWVPSDLDQIDWAAGPLPLAGPSPTDPLPTGNMVQQLYRLQDEQGCEVIYGTVRADFVAGQRTAVVHVGFCPPLSYLPEIEAEALPGLTAKVKVVQAMAHGTRLDVRLSAPASSDCQLWIDMAAQPHPAVSQTMSA